MAERRIVVGWLLFFALVAAYLLVYQGQLLMSDERTLFDSAQSFIRRGELYPTYEYNLTLTRADDVPWNQPAHEPLPIYVTALFTLIGRVLPDIGMIHTALLMNIVLTAFIGVSLYSVGLMLGYSMRAALIAALLFGVATNAFPYTRTLFREPQMGLFVLWCCGLAIVARRRWIVKGHVPFGLLMGVAVTFIGAVLTKIVAVLLLPGVIVLLLPSLDVLRRNWRSLVVGGVVLLGGLGMLIVLSQSPLLAGTRYDWTRWEPLFINIGWSSMLESLLGYQISPGRSIWVYTPLLLVGWWGAWRLVKQGEWRLVVAPLVVILVMSPAYGAIHRDVWWGGWGWGPRYFTPLLPVMMLWLLPIFDSPRTRLQNISIGSIAIVSVAIQLLGVLVPLSNYYTELHFSGHAIFNEPEPWMAINWTWEWGPIHYHLEHLDFAIYDGAWNAVDNGIVVAIVIGVTLLVSIFAVFWLVSAERRRSLLGGAVLIVTALSIVTVSVAMLSLRDDPRYVEAAPDMVRVITTLNAEADNQDAVFIDQPVLTPLFMNWLKTPGLAVTLESAPGERFGTDDPLVQADATRIQQAGIRNVTALDWAAARYDRLWLVTTSSPFEVDKRRPIERYLVERYFPITEFEIAPQARVIAFASSLAAIDAAPQIETRLCFGESIQLDGYDLPLGDTYAAGQVVPVTLYWSTNTVPDFNYNVGVFVLNADGMLVAERNAQPQSTFGVMTQWQPEQVYLDNHGLMLPEDLPAGEYRIAVVVYNWQTQERLPLEADSEQTHPDIANLGTIVIER